VKLEFHKATRKNKEILKKNTCFFCFDIAYNISMKGVVFMAQTVNVNFKLDADVKKSMEQACSDMGLSMSAAFTIFAKKVGRERRIPFEVSADPFYSESNIRYLEQKMADYKAGKIKLAEHELIEE
jgi:DNA-damage-inducible protein J